MDTIWVVNNAPVHVCPHCGFYTPKGWLRRWLDRKKSERTNDCCPHCEEEFETLCINGGYYTRPLRQVSRKNMQGRGLVKPFRKRA